jgi:hypothetical protein
MTLRAVVEPVLVGRKRRRLVFDALSLLRPFDLPGERKVHIGTPGDGSYVMVDRLRPSQPVMSFGVGPSVEFEMEMAERGHAVFTFDHTIDSLPAEHPRFTWFREGITGGLRLEKGLFTLAEHMEVAMSRSRVGGRRDRCSAARRRGYSRHARAGRRQRPPRERAREWW